MGKYLRDSEEQKKKRSLEDFQKTLDDFVWTRVQWRNQ